MKLLNPIPNSKLLRYPQGNLRQAFGENPQWYPAFGGHPGIDLATFENDTIVATHDGLVIQTKDNPSGYGRAIYLFNEELGIITIYGHGNKVLVKVGQQVKAGDPISLEGNSGFIIAGGTTKFWGNAPAGEGIHLHFGLITNVKKGAYPGFQIKYESGIIITYQINQGLKGCVDPLPYLKAMLRTYKNEYGEIFEIRNGRRYKIRTMENFNDGKAENLYAGEPTLITDKELRAKYKEGGIVG